MRIVVIAFFLCLSAHGQQQGFTQAQFDRWVRGRHELAAIRWPIQPQCGGELYRGRLRGRKGGFGPFRRRWRGRREQRN